MTKLTLCLIAIALCAVLEISFAGSIVLQHKIRDQFGNQIGSANGKCSDLSGLLPDPKSGCCGRHSEEVVKKDAVKNVDKPDEITNPGNGDSEIGSEIINNDEKININRNSVKCIDIGGIVNNVVDAIRDRVTTWISKFSDKEAQASTNSRPSDIMSLIDEKIILNEVDDYKSSSPGFSDNTQTGLREYPWLVRFTIDNDDDGVTSVTTCEGTLTSPRFVLTAADCFNKAYKSLDDIKIFLGEYNINISSDCVGATCVETVNMRPDKIVIHKDFDHKSNSLSDNIALMRLKGSAPYTEYIRPICLPPYDVDMLKNPRLKIAGWGSTDRGASPIKQAAQTQVVPQNQCKKYFSQLTPAQICTVGHTGETCLGNSGGPLMVEKDGSFYLVGVTSGQTFSACGSSKPRIYTNLFAYLKWIQDNMNV